MSRVRSDKFTNRAATGPCTFTHGMHSTDTAGTGIGVSLGYGGIVAVGATISGNLSVGGTITYEDTTNVDSTGIVTARNGIKVGQPTGVGATFNPAGDLVVAGVATVGTGLSMPDSAKAYFGTGGDLTIYHNGSHSYLTNGTGNLYITAKSDEDGIIVRSDAQVELYYNNINNKHREILYRRFMNMEISTIFLSSKSYIKILKSLNFYLGSILNS